MQSWLPLSADDSDPFAAAERQYLASNVQAIPDHVRELARRVKQAMTRHIWA
jgi:hypothetical protein